MVKVYHGTTPERAELILKNGFNTELVYFTPSKIMATYYGPAIISWDSDPEDWVDDPNCYSGHYPNEDDQYFMENWLIPIDEDAGLKLETTNWRESNFLSKD